MAINIKLLKKRSKSPTCRIFKVFWVYMMGSGEKQTEHIICRISWPDCWSLCMNARSWDSISKAVQSNSSCEQLRLIKTHEYNLCAFFSEVNISAVLVATGSYVHLSAVILTDMTTEALVRSQWKRFNSVKKVHRYSLGDFYVLFFWCHIYINLDFFAQLVCNSEWTELIVSREHTVMQRPTIKSIC